MILVYDVCPVGGRRGLFLDVVSESLPGIQEWEAVAWRVFGNDEDDADPERTWGLLTPISEAKGLRLARVSFGLTWITSPTEAVAPGPMGLQRRGASGPHLQP